ncbi:growth factor receptor-bound protein 7 isoform X1 [Xenopus laevis]|uniref:Growth factor receptor-bound protein 7 isoform X1 n=3 Tax=Xenopus laevis TaxID=8355 RepID=A0A8J1LTM3_XENLA|nr:growth factor receptor-bound protein 7 isoform X1 [Xenopus laevis]
MFLGEERRLQRSAGRQRNRRLCWRQTLQELFCCMQGQKSRERGPGEKRACELLIENKEYGGDGIMSKPKDIVRIEESVGEGDDMDLEALESSHSPAPDNLYEREGCTSRCPSTQQGHPEKVELLTPDLKRSQPLLIQSRKWGRLRDEESRSASLPDIPNPFPELCNSSPILNNTPSGRSPKEGGPHVVKVYSEDGTCRSLEVTAGATARHVCDMLVERVHCLSDESWSLMELHPHLGIERCLEDHESVVEVQAMWPAGGDSNFIFRKNFAKYELFRGSPYSLFPEDMVGGNLEVQKGLTHSELVQNFLNSGSWPEIQGYLHMKESGRKVWKCFFFFLRRSGLYYSTKGTSKDPRHLQYFADVNESNLYCLTQGKKMYTAPTEFGFCLKALKMRSGTKGLKILCTEDEQAKTCWLTAIRLFKYGAQLYKNYQISKRNPHSWAEPTKQRSASDSTLVPMDFSGCTGRVIENPLEALSVALEEAQSWRKKTTHRYSLPTPCQATPPNSAGIHKSQAWYHGRLSRDETQRLIMQQGMVDGVFLVRESTRNAKGFVLSLCHLQKIKHYLILPCEEEGRPYYSMDDGETKFIDLIQLVEFHQINRGILPCTLKHYCTNVAL